MDYQRQPPLSEKCRIILDFRNEPAMWAWLQDCIAAGLLPDEMQPYPYEHEREATKNKVGLSRWFYLRRQK